YKEMKIASFKRDIVPSLLHSAKFSDLSLALVENYLDKVRIDINKIETGKIMNRLIRRTKTTPEESILTLAIPRAVSIIHTVRNKKDVAHVKSIDPDSFDIYLCESTCDWILSQLVCIIHGGTQEDVEKIIVQITERKVPWLQRFENGTMLLLVTDRPLKDQILLVLYHNQNLMNAKEIADIMQYSNFNYVHTLLETFVESRFVQKSRRGLVDYYRISLLGEAEAEKILEEVQFN
ncbi:MAG: hypothetical protein ACTSQ8_25555, partial [Candidatus Helarchaeota archaeon]